MWWILFTAVDLYIGFVVLKAMEPTVPPEKHGRLKIVEKVILILLGLSVLALVAKLLR